MTVFLLMGTVVHLFLPTYLAPPLTHPTVGYMIFVWLMMVRYGADF
ncbi:hypothetical protein [Planktothricoides raciborskii]|nr:hypothetical protein [Planktothricoides raciborskii]MBD2581297.1 hypothetical protein [Planktothricoides raciborskii FACHB-1261]